MSDKRDFQHSLVNDPDSMIALTKAGLLFSEGLFAKAEPLFRQIPIDHPQYHVAVSGLFNVLWAKGTAESKEEAQTLLDHFLSTADRSNPQIKPVVANFIKIKIDLLQKGEWTREVD